LFGEHIAGGRDGWIDPKAKARGDIYIAFVLLETQNTRNRLSDVKVGEVMQSLRNHSYMLFVGGVSLYATSGRYSQGAGASFDSGSCALSGTGLHGWESSCI